MSLTHGIRNRSPPLFATTSCHLTSSLQQMSSRLEPSACRIPEILPLPPEAHLHGHSLATSAIRSSLRRRGKRTWRMHENFRASICRSEQEHLGPEMPDFDQLLQWPKRETQSEPHRTRSARNGPQATSKLEKAMQVCPQLTTNRGVPGEVYNSRRTLDIVEVRRLKHDIWTLATSAWDPWYDRRLSPKHILSIEAPLKHEPLRADVYSKMLEIRLHLSELKVMLTTASGAVAGRNCEK